jgi:hypothetical protein
MSRDSTDLSIVGESVQTLYAKYLQKDFLVNRRYQRKLVWTLDEKRSFIDSIVNGYPVPLVLLAEVTVEGSRKLEIIDGMQRLNAIMSFIDQEFDVDSCYFDLDAMADTKLLKDTGVVLQKKNALDRTICASIARYKIPLSVFQDSRSGHIDEVFRRLNSGGRHLSKQELRQAGATSKFSTIVRKLASNIRGDASASDILDLNLMKNISIRNKNLDYGISVDDIFWIKHNIITKDALRQSNDEEILADIVAWVAMGKPIRSSSDILDQYYDFSIHGESDDDSLAQQVESQIQKINPEVIIHNIQYVLDALINVITQSGRTFNSLLFAKQQAKISRYFQIVFLTFYKLLIDNNMDISNYKALIEALDKAGEKVVKLGAGGGKWSAKEKLTNINALTGVIESCFKQSGINDPARNEWITRFENILMQSSTEQTLYDFKIGFHDLSDSGESFNKSAFSKIIKTLTSMANTLPSAVGYCIIGVSDSLQSTERYESHYSVSSVKYSSFQITGIEAEAKRYHENIDNYYTKITNLIKGEPISERDIDCILRNIITVKYFQKTVIILKIESGEIPSIYDNKYYVRHGSNIEEISPSNFMDLFNRFSKK